MKARLEPDQEAYLILNSAAGRQSGEPHFLRELLISLATD